MGFDAGYISVWNLYAEQMEYMEWDGMIKNSWGFGNQMRDYLLEGWRRIRLLPRTATDGDKS